MVLINITCPKENSWFPTPTFQLKNFLLSFPCQEIAPLFVIFGSCLFLNAHTWYTGRSFWFCLQRIFKYDYFSSFLLPPPWSKPLSSLSRTRRSFVTSIPVIFLTVLLLKFLQRQVRVFPIQRAPIISKVKPAPPHGLASPASPLSLSYLSCSGSSNTLRSLWCLTTIPFLAQMFCALHVAGSFSHRLWFTLNASQRLFHAHLSKAPSKGLHPNFLSQCQPLSLHFTVFFPL